MFHGNSKSRSVQQHGGNNNGGVARSNNNSRAGSPAPTAANFMQQQQRSQNGSRAVSMSSGQNSRANSQSRGATNNGNNNNNRGNMHSSSQQQQQQQQQRPRVVVPRKQDAEELDSSSCRQTPYPLYLKGAIPVGTDELVSETYSENAEQQVQQQQPQRQQPMPMQNNAGKSTRPDGEDEMLECSVSFEGQGGGGVCGMDALSPLFQGRSAALPMSLQNVHLNNNYSNNNNQQSAATTRSQPADMLPVPQKPRSHSGRDADDEDQDHNDDGSSLELDHADSNNHHNNNNSNKNSKSQDGNPQSAMMTRQEKQLEQIRQLEQQRQQINEARDGGADRFPPVGTMMRKIDTTTSSTATSAAAAVAAAAAHQLVTVRSRHGTPSPAPTMNQATNTARQLGVCDSGSAVLDTRQQRQNPSAPVTNNINNTNNNNNNQRVVPAVAASREAAVSRAMSNNNNKLRSAPQQQQQQQQQEQQPASRNASASVSALRPHNTGNNNNTMSNFTATSNALHPQQHFSGEFDDDETEHEEEEEKVQQGQVAGRSSIAAALEDDADLMVAITEATFCGNELHGMVDNFVKRQTRYLKRLGRRAVVQKRRYDEAVMDAEQGYERARLDLAASCEKRVESLDSVCAALRGEIKERTVAIQRLESDHAAMTATLNAASEQLRETQKKLIASEQEAKDLRDAADEAERVASDLGDQLVKEQERYRELQRQHIAAATVKAMPAYSDNNVSAPPLMTTAESSKASSASSSRPAFASVTNSQQHHNNSQPLLQQSNIHVSNSSINNSSSTSSSNHCNNVSCSHIQQQQQQQASRGVQPYQPKVFVLSGFAGAERDRLANSIQALGGSIAQCAPDMPLPPKVTHVVAGSHTPKAVAGMLASGNSQNNTPVWVVPASFIHISFKNGTWANEQACGGIASDLERWRRLFPIVVVPRRSERDAGAEEVCRLLTAHGFTLVEESASMPEATARTKSLAALYQQMRPQFLDM